MGESARARRLAQVQLRAGYLSSTSLLLFVRCAFRSRALLSMERMLDVIVKDSFHFV